MISEGAYEGGGVLVPGVVIGTHTGPAERVVSGADLQDEGDS